MRPGITYLEDENCILVNPPTFPSEEVKNILGGRALYEGKKQNKTFMGWRLQLTAWNVLTLAEWYGPKFLDGAPQEVLDLFYLDWGFPGFEEHPDLKKKAEAHPNWNKLYNFQKIAVEYAVCNPHRGTLLGLSPGLGKTVVSVLVMDILLSA